MPLLDTQPSGAIVVTGQDAVEEAASTGFLRAPFEHRRDIPVGKRLGFLSRFVRAEPDAAALVVPHADEVAFVCDADGAAPMTLAHGLGELSKFEIAAGLDRIDVIVCPIDGLVGLRQAADSFPSLVPEDDASRVAQQHAPASFLQRLADVLFYDDPDDDD